MDRYEKTAHLEWRASPSTCLARIPVGATVTANTVEWAAVVSGMPTLASDRDFLWQTAVPA